MRVDEFDFDLPEELIALRPAQPRDVSRLLIVEDKFHDLQFSDITRYIEPGDVLVINNTKVLPAALKGVRPSREVEGQSVEVEFNLHKALPPGPYGETRWAAFARPAKRVKKNDRIIFSDSFSAVVEERDGAEAILCFDGKAADFLHRLQEAGSIPLPPYIGRKREVDAQDRVDYQTVFAKAQGSVAAPTAGLHFTPELLNKLKDKGVILCEVTLHVGAGTFLPVSVDDTKDHVMHAEWGEISKTVADTINQAKQKSKNVICVGTTSLRLLESAASPDGQMSEFRDETDIFITPGYQFRIVDRLITNFHLPRSTLFMLVSAFAGTEKMKKAYQHAIETGYRFYSYGDASLLTCEQER